MKLVLIRHGHADDTRPDSERALTEEGKAKFAKAFQAALNYLPKPEIIMDSRFRRARETADIVAEHFEKCPRESHVELQPEFDPRDCIKFLQERSVDCIYLVGHNPHISMLAAYLLGSEGRPVFVFKKGAILLLEGEFVDGYPEFKTRSFMSSKQLCQLDKKS